MGSSSRLQFDVREVLPSVVQAGVTVGLAFPGDALKTRKQLDPSLNVYGQLLHRERGQTLQWTRQEPRPGSNVGVLYRGARYQLMGLMLKRPIEFVIFERMIKDKTYSNSSAGMIAATLGSFVASPFNLLKVRSQSAQCDSTLASSRSTTSTTSGRRTANKLRAGAGSPQTGLSLFLKDPRKMTQGLSNSMAFNIGAGGVWLAIYGEVRQLCREKWSLSHISSGLVAGYCASASAWACVLPFDTIRTHQQRQTHKAPMIPDSLRSAVKTHGLARALYSAYPLTLLWLAPVSGCAMASYEFTRTALAGNFQWSPERALSTVEEATAAWWCSRLACCLNVDQY